MFHLVSSIIKIQAQIMQQLYALESWGKLKKNKKTNQSVSQFPHTVASKQRGLAHCLFFLWEKRKNLLKFQRFSDISPQQKVLFLFLGNDITLLYFSITLLPSFVHLPITAKIEIKNSEKNHLNFNKRYISMEVNKNYFEILRLIKI